jgi:HD-GYP domain-containing protein (c-di-GMP phosphodiesterase class II)
MGKSVKTILKEYGLREEESSLTLRDLADAYMDQKLLISIGRNLSVERDTEKLLRMILQASREITCADAGSIFLLEDDGRQLRFKYSHTYSLELDYQEFVMKRDTHSIAGYVSITGEILNIADAYFLDASLPYSFNSSFDREHGYRTKSMLVVPMKNHLDEVIGVIQLINSKECASDQKNQDAVNLKLQNADDFETRVVPFKPRYDSLMVAVANQAAIALENSRMIKQIQEEFEAFVSASVVAVESRDPATSGHSHRVSALAELLGVAVSKARSGAYANRTLSATELKELKLAGLLHDFGKVYIDPQVFQKAKKLYPRDYDYLMMRLNYLYRTVELGYSQRENDLLSTGKDGPTLDQVKNERNEILQELLGIEHLVSSLNEPQATNVDPNWEIERILMTHLPDYSAGIDGRPIPLLTEDEVVNLSIPRGSLNDDERRIIQSHVEHTYAFVSKIPWPPEFRNIPEYTYKHHEMLDGSGYPQGITAEDIPLQARILAVCDVYDALIAADRPYKKALSLDRVVDILREEGGRGRLDKDLVELFVENRVWERLPSIPEGSRAS